MASTFKRNEQVFEANERTYVIRNSCEDSNERRDGRYFNSTQKLFQKATEDNVGETVQYYESKEGWCCTNSTLFALPFKGYCRGKFDWAVYRWAQLHAEAYKRKYADDRRDSFTFHNMEGMKQKEDMAKIKIDAGKQ